MPALCEHNNLDMLHGDGRGQDVAALGGSGAEESARRPQRAHKVFFGTCSGLWLLHRRVPQHAALLWIYRARLVPEDRDLK